MTRAQMAKIDDLARATGTSRVELLLLAREELHNARIQSLHELTNGAADALIRTLQAIEIGQLVNC